MRNKVALSCTDCSTRNYETTIKEKNHAERLELKKFCKTCNRHTVHKQTK